MFCTTHRIFVFLSLILIGILWNCKKSPVEPEKPQPGRRDYVWNVDTLDMPMNYISSVWGASPNDVWAVGAGGTYNDRLLHYDGERWTTYNKEPIWCTGNVIFGFSEDDIWMGGGAGWVAHGAGIWHYDGTKWSQNYVYDIQDSPLMYVQDLWGEAPDNIYASGLFVLDEDSTENAYGFLLHFNGKKWQEIVKANFESQFLTVRKEREKVYLFSSSERVDGKHQFYTLKDGQLTMLYSDTDARGLYSISGKVYFIINNTVYRYINNTFVKQLSMNDANVNGLIYGIYGRNEIDIFFGMKSAIAHYNGADIQYLYRFPNNKNVNIMKNAVVMEKDVFFCVRDYSGSRNLVIHAELKE